MWSYSHDFPVLAKIRIAHGISTDLRLYCCKKYSRPYSAIDISANLHNKVTKAYTAKALRELHEKKQVEGRALGKQIVYHAIQDAIDEATPEGLAGLDEEIEAFKSQVASAKSQNKLLKAELTTLNARVSTSELRQCLAALEGEKRNLIASLAPSKASSVQAKAVTAEEKASLEKEWRKWRKHVTVRKKICHEMWMRCTEVLPEAVQGKEELWESLGLEGSPRT
ncbi:uncharacterized protein CIMG_10871 [Coccidioides immitis RS]|uniref:Homologous-pairing protein 2 winged helix domain-containing protein n=1 Tax=Coccidioides immitis (strain RS) TaxID=246410 RepID=A0A0D8JRU2_COCIM|nr:uncharacterized protein CIMG_10871 [Coccidioides immitis RS]KJF60070.1 hypothetical protein CIMG_10871 [Coccidioides immitis RS]